MSPKQMYNVCLSTAALTLFSIITFIIVECHVKQWCVVTKGQVFGELVKIIIVECHVKQ